MEFSAVLSVLPLLCSETMKQTCMKYTHKHLKTNCCHCLYLEIVKTEKAPWNKLERTIKISNGLALPLFLIRYK